MSRKKVILVVDDYAPSRYTFRRILSAERFEVREAEDVASAWLELTPELDAVLLDVNLPDGSGVEFCREIRENLPRLPVILISSSYRASAEAPEWRDAGATAFLEQPISAEGLLSELEQAIPDEVRERGE